MNAKPFSLFSKNTSKLFQRIKLKYWGFIPLFWCFLFNPAWNSTATAQQVNAFYIGHSLSDQIPDMVKSLSEDHPEAEMDWIYQSIPGAPLRWQWDRMAAGDYTSNPPHYYGFYHPTEGLPSGNFDILVLTESVPRHIEPWGIEETYQYAGYFAAYASGFSPDIKIFIYEVWHCLLSGTPTGCDYDIDTNPWRERLDDDLPMWESVVDHLNSEFELNREVCLIPAGQGLAKLYDEIAAGTVPGISDISELFSDNIHLTDEGKYFVACIHFAMLHNISPIGLTNELQVWWGGDFDAPSPELAERFQEIALETAMEYPNSCFNSGYAELEVEIIWSYDISCFGYSDGLAEAKATGGDGNYSYNWPNGDSGPYASWLESGIHEVTVTDGTGATAFASVEIGEPDPLEIVLIDSAHVSCFGYSDGSLSVMAQGGVGEYTYYWFQGDRTEMVSNLSPGIYSIQVVDDNNCYDYTEYTITEPPPIFICTSYIHPSCPQCKDGTAGITAVGGVGNYTYLWNTDPPQFSATATGLAAGTYSVTVTDTNNCSKTAEVTLIDPLDSTTNDRFYYNQNRMHCTAKSLESLYLELPDSIHQDSIMVCDTSIILTNPVWYNFVAGDSLFHIMATIDSCTQQRGVCLGLFELACELEFDPESKGIFPAESDLATSCDLLLNPHIGEVELVATTVPGNTYGLMVAGWESDRCSFEVSEVIRAENAPDICHPKWNSQELKGPPMGTGLCQGAKEIPFILEDMIQSGCNYIWTVENLFNNSIVDVSITPSSQNTAYFTFPDTGDFKVCVVSSNHCSSTPPICTEVSVRQLDPVYMVDTTCKSSNYDLIGPFGNVLETYEGFADDWGFGMDPNPDPFEDMKTTESQWGCIVDVFLQLYVIPDNFPPSPGDEEYFQEVICFGDHFEMPDGSQYTQTGIYGTEGEIFIPQQKAFPQCDSFFILELSVLEVRLNWDDPVCLEDIIFIIPKSVPLPPEFLPGGDGQEIYIQWVRLSDKDTLFVGNHSQGTLIDGLIWEITPDYFNNDRDTFEVTIIMDIDGEPDPGCVFGPWHIDLDINDYFSVTSEITGPETAIRDSLLAFSATHPPGEIDSTLQYHWTVRSNSDDFTVVNDDSTANFEVLFHTPGIHEVCLYVLNVDSLCGFSKTVCHEILVESPVPVVGRDGEEWHLNIFPNPAKDHLIVESDDLKGKIEISIISLDGKQIKTYIEVFEDRSLIPLDGLPAGMYFIQIHREGTSVQKPFYKN